MSEIKTKGRPSPIDKHVGERLRILRCLRGLTQEKLGEEIGLTFQQIQKYERGTNRVSAGRLYEISTILGVDVQYFFNGQSEQEGEEGQQRGLDFVSAAALRTAGAFDKLKKQEQRIVMQLIAALLPYQEEGGL